VEDIHIRTNNEPLSNINSGIYDGYQVPMHSLETHQFQMLLACERTGRVLDVGCADDQFAGYLNQSGWVCFGNDINLTNALMASERGVNTVVCDLSFLLAYVDRSFDVVVAKQVCEHLVDRRMFFLECWGVLHPGGCLMVGTPNLASLTNRVRLLFGPYPAYMDYKLVRGQGHVRDYTMDVLREQLVSIGFHIDKQLRRAVPVPIVSRFLSGGTARPLAWLGRMVPSLSDNLVIKARKSY